MRAGDVGELLVELEARFPEYSLPDGYRQILANYDNNEEITFHQFAEIIQAVSDARKSERLGFLGIFDDRNRYIVDKEITINVCRSKSSDSFGSGGRGAGFYRERAGELEKQLDEVRRSNDELAMKVANLQVENSRLYRQVKLKGGGLDVQVKASLDPKMMTLIEDLLQATQVLSKDRRELYGQLFDIVQGARISKRDLTKRLALENELIGIYNGILNNTKWKPTIKLDDDNFTYAIGNEALRGHSPDKIVLASRSATFVAYTFLVWLVGILSCLLMHEYVASSDWALSFPTAAIY